MYNIGPKNDPRGPPRDRSWFYFSIVELVGDVVYYYNQKFGVIVIL